MEKNNMKYFKTFESMSKEDRISKLYNNSFVVKIAGNSISDEEVLNKIKKYLTNHDLDDAVSVEIVKHSKTDITLHIALKTKSKGGINYPINFFIVPAWTKNKKLKDLNNKTGVFENINEKLINRKKDAEIFNYRYIVEEEWRKLIRKAKDFQKISFDTENDEKIEKKTLYIAKNLRKDQPVKYEFNIELHVAGGDWECPVMYFRTQFTTSYGLTSVDYEKNPEYVFDVKGKDDDKIRLSNSHVFIPPQDAGNPLNKTDKGYAAYDDDSLYKAGLKKENVKLKPENYKKAWKWIESFLTELVEKRHKMLD